MDDRPRQGPDRLRRDLRVQVRQVYHSPGGATEGARNGRCGRWRDLPERFGPWKTVYERHRLWSADGAWERLLQQVQAAADIAGEIDRDIAVDSPSCGLISMRRGGFTSKLHLSAAGRCRPLSVVVTPGQRAGCPPAQGLTRRTATWLRRGAVQETQHRRAGDQQAQAVPGRRPPVVTSAATCSSAPQPQRSWSSGSALDRPDRS
ncbi:transposase [Streptomyces sp. NPDC050164]|uniref:transposase n=1 Tax=Streptomyces sp. NPDC050164 TaxID=3365605 RepID=UPI0037A5B587